MNCKIYRREIEHLESIQTLNADTSAHIESCAACFEFKREHDSLQNLIGNLERVNAPANFDAKLRARLAPAKAHKQHSFTFANFSLLRPAMGFGFVLVLLVVGLVFIRPLFTDENKPLNGVAKLSSFNLEGLSKDDISSTDKQDIVRSSAPDNEITPPRDKKYRNETARNTIGQREKQIVADTSLTGARIEDISGIFIPVRTDSRSQFVFLNDKKVPLRSVSFGLPTFVDGKTVRTNYASDSQGIW